MGTRISRGLRENIFAHAASDPAREVCGLLLGEGFGRIEAAVPCANVAANPDDSFEIDPAALFAALKAERAGGPRVIGCYHSHPLGPASPSVRDAAAVGRPGWLWLILGGGEAEATVWREEPGGPAHDAFAPVALKLD